MLHNNVRINVFLFGTSKLTLIFSLATSSRRGKVVDSVKMKVLAHLEHFAIQLEDSKRPIANLIVSFQIQIIRIFFYLSNYHLMLQIENVNASVVMKSSYTEVGVVLQDIQVIDLNPETKHPTVSTSLKMFYY